MDITPEVQKLIDDAVAKARASPLTAETIERIRMPHKDILTLDDRPPDFERLPAEHVQLGIVRASIAFEEQPMGLCKHLSVGVEMPEALPPVTIFIDIAKAFGMEVPSLGVTWIEEWKPNHYAIHLVDLADKGEARLKAIENMAITEAIRELVKEGKIDA